MSEQPTNLPDELQVSRSREPIFRKYVNDLLDALQRGILEESLIHAGSEKAEISPVTAKRYLAKMCSIEGNLVRYTSDGHLCVKKRIQHSPASTSNISSETG